MNSITEKLPRFADETRSRIYGGEIFLTAGSSPSKRLASEAFDVVDSVFSDAGGAHRAQFTLSPEAFFERVKGLRRRFFEEQHWQVRMGQVAQERGFDLARCAFDPLRLRCVQSDGHLNPRAAPVYGAHRDVWYAHPPCLITWWLPLHDVPEEETFEFFPERLRLPVPNDSETFDYGAWVQDGPQLKIGWQDIDAGQRETFPALLREPAEGLGEALGFRCSAGDELLFSGAHLHRTLPHRSGRTRFSFDFRLVDLIDEAEGHGALVVDNRSRGTAVPGYLRLQGGDILR